MRNIMTSNKFITTTCLFGYTHIQFIPHDVFTWIEINVSQFFVSIHLDTCGLSLIQVQPNKTYRRKYTITYTWILEERLSICVTYNVQMDNNMLPCNMCIIKLWTLGLIKKKVVDPSQVLHDIHTREDLGRSRTVMTSKCCLLPNIAGKRVW